MIERKARHLPAHLGASGWNAILPQTPRFPKLEVDALADFVIIGAGFAGLAAARKLRELEPKASIVILEASQIAEGAAGRNSGFMIDLPHDLTSEDYSGGSDERSLIKLNRQAQKFAEHALLDYQIDINYFDKAGKINGAASEIAHAHNESYAAHLEGLGEAYESLDAKEMQNITGSRHYRSGLYTPGTIMLQPAGFIRGLASGLANQNVQIYTSSPALSFKRAPQGWEIQTPKARISTPKIILTVNGHLASFGYYANALMQIFLFASMTAEISSAKLKSLGGQSRWGITPSDPMGTTMRRIDSAQGGDRIVTRTCSVLRSGMKATRRDLSRAKKTMREKFDQRFPELVAAPMEFAWAGHLCLTLNGVSVAEELENGVYVACVQNGLGTTRGILTGIAAAETAYGAKSEITDFFKAQDAPKKLPPEPLRGWGANAYMRWKEHKARAE